MDGDSWEELGHGDVKKCDLVIWVILLINKIYVLRLENSTPTQPPRTKELKRILVSSRVTNKVEIDDVSQTLSTFLTGMNFPNYLASLEKSSE